MYLAQSFRRPRDGAESQCNYRRIEGPCPKWKVLCVGRHYEDGSIRSRCAAASKRQHRNVGIDSNYDGFGSIMGEVQARASRNFDDESLSRPDGFTAHAAQRPSVRQRHRAIIQRR